jgi:hypothetical protein
MMQKEKNISIFIYLRTSASNYENTFAVVSFKTLLTFQVRASLSMSEPLLALFFYIG